MIYLHDDKYLPVKRVSSSQVTSVLKGGLAVTEQKRELAVTEIVFDTASGFKKGTKVYLHPGAGFQPFNKEIYMVGNTEFVLVPKDVVFAIEGAPR